MCIVYDGKLFVRRLVHFYPCGTFFTHMNFSFQFSVFFFVLLFLIYFGSKNSHRIFAKFLSSRAAKSQLCCFISYSELHMHMIGYHVVLFFFVCMLTAPHLKWLQNNKSVKLDQVEGSRGGGETNWNQKAKTKLTNSVAMGKIRYS